MALAKTVIFDLYLRAINESLAEKLDFNPQTPLVQKALASASKAILDSKKPWLNLTEAEELVNSFLPNRGFERSLYRGLIEEGILVADLDLARWYQGTDAEEIVFLGYERFADYLAAKTLLDRHLDPQNPSAVFAEGGSLAFLYDRKEYISHGLLEALCVQVPERIGQELVSIAPACANRSSLGDAFRQSLVWRACGAFSDDTYKVLNELCRGEYDRHDTLDVLLTVATLPGHPLNAIFLDRRLRKDAMPDRDAWWSVYLHQAWETHSIVSRLVDWASSLSTSTSIDDDVIDLCAIALSWMLATSNRFLRDRATKALVNLLTNRLTAATRLVDRFADIDDLYIAERVYAVAYGVAMRCNDPDTVGSLAACVYDRVFVSGSPPPHILLRDYARGVVERAIYLGASIEVIPERIRPPYNSDWPTIPTEEAVKPLLPDWSKGSYDSMDLEWGRNCIGGSVMSGDFARYVIGTNSSSTNWLSLRLNEPPWDPPSKLADRLQVLIEEFSAEEQQVWKEFNNACEAYTTALESFKADQRAQHQQDEVLGDLSDSEPDALENEFERDRPPEVTRFEDAISALEDVLSEEHAQQLDEIWTTQENHQDLHYPPYFDLKEIQRYVLWRVFDLGWTTERFGYFDRFVIRSAGRDASKPERIGKKYQWIAYHEIMAFVSDNFQYREQFGKENGDLAYEGPWQDYLRDIDPSCTLRSLRGGTSWDGHTTAWWGVSQYAAWGDSSNPRDWLVDNSDLPKIEDLLVVTNTEDGSRWVNGLGYFNWKQPTPADRESTDVERRELWYMFTGYLLQADDVRSFLKWAEGVDFWGRWMPEAPEIYRMFLGEHGWAPASKYFQNEYFGDEGWTNPERGCPVRIRCVAFEYLHESSGFDCSVDDGYTLRLPASEFVNGLNIRWSGRGADFIDATDRIAVQDPTVYTNGPSALLFREDLLSEFLDREKFAFCWTILGGKEVLSPNFGACYYPSLRISGAYELSGGFAVGSVKHMVNDPKSQ